MLDMRHILLGLALCAPAACTHKSAEPSDEVVARVGEGPILRSQFQAQVDRSLARYTSQGKTLPPGITARIEESVMRRMLDDTIVEQKAEKLGVQITDAQLDAASKENKERFRTEQAFADYLRTSNNTEAVWRDDLRRGMLRDAVVDKLSGPVTVSDDEVEKFYHENLNHYVDPEQMRLRRILFTLAPNAEPTQKKAVQKEAKKVRDALRRPKRDFAALAREYGKGPEASRDGDLSIVTPGRMPELDKAMTEGLKPGQTTEVLPCEQGFAILRLDEHTLARQKPLDEVRETIRRQLTMRESNERRQAILRQLKGDASIEVFIKFDAQALQAHVTPTAATPTAPASSEAKAP